MTTGVSYYEANPNDHGQRLDNLLLKQMKGCHRTSIYKCIRKGSVRVNGGRSRPSYRVQLGDVIRIPPHHSALQSSLTPSSLAWLKDCVIDDYADYLVLNKPPGLAVHGGSEVGINVVDGLRVLYPDSLQIGLAHRLDRATSGCLLVAKNRSALVYFHKLFADRAVTKYYLAVVQGAWPQDCHVINTPLKREGDRVLCHEAGQSAQTYFKVLARHDKVTLLGVTPHTGRMHQIRVHCASVGHPILGDTRYGPRSKQDKHLYLHAKRITVIPPGEAKARTYTCPLPPHFQAHLLTHFPE